MLTWGGMQPESLPRPDSVSCFSVQTLMFLPLPLLSCGCRDCWPWSTSSCLANPSKITGKSPPFWTWWKTLWGSLDLSLHHLGQRDPPLTQVQYKLTQSEALEFVLLSLLWFPIHKDTYKRSFGALHSWIKAKFPPKVVRNICPRNYFSLSLFFAFPLFYKNQWTVGKWFHWHMKKASTVIICVTLQQQQACGIFKSCCCRSRLICGCSFFFFFKCGWKTKLEVTILGASFQWVEIV